MYISYNLKKKKNKELSFSQGIIKGYVEKPLGLPRNFS